VDLNKKDEALKMAIELAAENDFAKIFYKSTVNFSN
jgi:hypothetical protein